MFNRSILRDLRDWAGKSDRKPLIMRGARQVGKTTAVTLFSEEFDQYIYLNCEKKEDNNLFSRGLDITDLIPAIYLHKEKKQTQGKTLIFIDEIQNSPEAVSMLRYFYEERKDIFVIAAGSLLESLISRNIHFPVGRVEYLYMNPVTFREFLEAEEKQDLLELLNTVPVPEYAHNKLLKEFYRYTLVGGMPEVVNRYIKTGDITSLNDIYESLLTSYLDDIEKYASNENMVHVLRHAVRSCFYEAGNRITFNGFGSSNYRSREMGEALRTLEKAMLIELVYPSTAVKPPLQPDLKKSPKLQIIDTGLVNYFAGLQKEIFGTRDLDDVYEGRIAEHIIGQELKARRKTVSDRLAFWVRQKRQSSAEVDFAVSFESLIIPIEVKAGSTGRLRSLHQFIEAAPHTYGVRIYSGPVQVDQTETSDGTAYTLLNIPFYLAGELSEYLQWFMTS